MIHITPTAGGSAPSMHSQHRCLQHSLARRTPGVLRVIRASAHDRPVRPVNTPAGDGSFPPRTGPEACHRAGLSGLPLIPARHPRLHGMLEGWRPDGRAPGVTAASRAADPDDARLRGGFADPRPPGACHPLERQGERVEDARTGHDRRRSARADGHHRSGGAAASP
jgi:hypothetical protein